MTMQELSMVPYDDHRETVELLTRIEQDLAALRRRVEKPVERDRFDPMPLKEEVR